MRLAMVSLMSATLLGAFGMPRLLAQEEQRPEAEMMERMRSRMQQMQHMRELTDPMSRVAAFAPPRLLEHGEQLGLTPEQRSTLESLAQELKEVHEKAETDAKTQREQLLAAWNVDEPDARSVQRYAQEMMQAQQGAHLAMLGAAAQAKALLTPEQRGRVLGWLDARRMMMHEQMEQMRCEERPRHRRERRRG
ncbi:MAG: Spy/CpxP family protein refolding chaperone [Armatimonadota bacterium]